MEDNEARFFRATAHQLTERYEPHGAPRILLTVEAAASQLSIGRTTMYALIRAGAVESVLVGRLRRIPADALTRYLEALRADLPKHDDSAA